MWKGGGKNAGEKMICMVLCSVLLVGTVALPANAVKTESTTFEVIEGNLISPLATGSFSITIPAKTKALADMNFPLAAGETVTIKASYSPFSASVDFGLVAPDGKFYCVNVTNGSIDKTIQVNESGSYTLQVKNNSSGEVEVSGFVNY